VLTIKNLYILVVALVHYE